MNTPDCMFQVSKCLVRCGYEVCFGQSLLDQPIIISMNSEMENVCAKGRQWDMDRHKQTYDHLQDREMVNSGISLEEALATPIS